MPIWPFPLYLSVSDLHCIVSVSQESTISGGREEAMKRLLLLMQVVLTRSPAPIHFWLFPRDGLQQCECAERWEGPSFLPSSLPGIAAFKSTGREGTPSLSLPSLAGGGREPGGSGPFKEGYVNRECTKIGNPTWTYSNLFSSSSVYGVKLLATEEKITIYMNGEWVAWISSQPTGQNKRKLSSAINKCLKRAHDQSKDARCTHVSRKWTHQIQISCARAPRLGGHPLIIIHSFFTSRYSPPSPPKSPVS